MAAKPVVRARIDEHLKAEAEAILASIGLTVSDAFRMMIVRIVREKALPFGPLVPNDETIAAMKAARRGEVLRAQFTLEFDVRIAGDLVLTDRPRHLMCPKDTVSDLTLFFKNLIRQLPVNIPPLRVLFFGHLLLSC